MMAGLAALRVDRIAELRLVATAEGVQVVEQHRDAEPMRRIPLPGDGRVAVVRAQAPGMVHRQIGLELATGWSRVQTLAVIDTPRPSLVNRRVMSTGKKLFVEDLTTAGKRVIVRVDFNVPLKDGK